MRGNPCIVRRVKLTIHEGGSLRPIRVDPRDNPLVPVTYVTWISGFFILIFYYDVSFNDFSINYSHAPKFLVGEKMHPSTAL